MSLRRALLCALCVATVLMASASVSPAKLKCTPTSACTDPDVVRDVRQAIDAACPCGEQASKKAYKKCAKVEFKRQKQALGSALPKKCKKEITRAFANSTCGRAGFVLCNKTNKKGKTICKVVKESKCTNDPGRSSVCGAFVSCADACNAEGGCAPPLPSTTSTTVAGSTTSTVPTTTTIVVGSTSTSLPTTTSTTSSTTTTIGGPVISLLETSPRSGEGGVALSRETVLRFSDPLAPATVTAAALQATAPGATLSPTRHLSPDGRTVTLFYGADLPANAQVRVTIDGAVLGGASGEGVDPDGNGVAGGVAVIDFQTLGIASIAGTSACGRVFASELGDGGMGTPLEGVTITVDGAESEFEVTTDAMGDFCLDPAPVGRFFVHIDGQTATNPIPAGAYYPTVGKAWETVAGRETMIGDVFLPLIAPDTLQAVSMSSDTPVTFPAAVLAANPELTGVEITVPADSLFADDGARGGMVGIAPVPADRLPGALPEFLDFPIVITVQTDGATNFDVPVPVCFPNLPDPETGQPLPAGAESATWSFNHDTGRFEMVGPATVTPDGTLVCSDPGFGIRAPGWHATDPSTRGGGRRGPPRRRPRPNDDGDDGDDEDDPDYDENDDKCEDQITVFCCPDTPGEARKYQGACYLVAEADASKCVFETAVGGDCQGLIDEFICYEIGALGDESSDCQDVVKAQFEDCVQHFIECEFQAGRSAARTPVVVPTPTDPLLAEVHGLLVPLFDDLNVHLDLESQLRALIGGATSDDQLTPQQATDIEALLVQLRALTGNLLPKEFYGPRHVQLDALLAQIAAQDGLMDSARSYYLLEDLSTGFIRRGRTEPGGGFANLILAPRTDYRLLRLTPGTLYYSETFFSSEPPGIPTRIPAAGRTFGPNPDDDGDGVSSRAEVVVGTNPSVPDTDADGVLDGAELRQGTDPLDGIAVAAGFLASAMTPGEAADVCAIDDFVAVADSEAGVSIYNAFNGLPPALVARIDTPGTAEAIACGAGFVAVADGDQGLTIIDVSNPADAAIVHQVDVSPFAGTVNVAVSGPFAYASTGGDVSLVDLATGAILGSHAYTSPPHVVDDVTVAGGALYVLTRELAGGSPTLHKVMLDGPPSPPVASVVLSGPTFDGNLAAGDGFIYVGGIDDPTVTPGIAIVEDQGGALVEVGLPSPLTAIDVSLNGSGLALFTGANALLNRRIGLLDVSDPATTDAFLTSFDTPGLPGDATAVTVFNGLGYVTDKWGVHALNYLAVDTAGQAPTVALTVSPQVGPNVEEGKALLLAAGVTDDVQVRNVEFLVDGQAIVTDGSYPFEQRLVTPLAAISPTITLQARATDTGGNDALSAPLVLTVVPDATPPVVITTSPGAGDTVAAGGTTAVAATFSEPIAEATLTTTSFQVFAAGPDEMIGTGDDVLLTDGTLDYRDELATALLTFPSLTSGDYRAIVRSTVTDLAGNALATDVAWTFEARGAVQWITDGDGFWDDPTNWSTGMVPGLGDVVLIDRPAANVTVTHRQDATSIASVTCAENLILSGGSLTLGQESMVDGSFELSNSAILDGDGDLTLGGSFLWGQGSMNGGGTTIVAGDMDVPSGMGFTVIGPGRRLETRGTASIGANGIQMSDGSTLANAAGGTLELLPGGDLRWNRSGTKPTFVNDGTFVGGSAEVQVAVTHTGTAQVTGMLELVAGLDTTATGTWTVDPGGQLILGGGSFAYGGTNVFAAGSEVTGDGIVTFGPQIPTFVAGTWNVAGQTQAASGSAEFQGDATTGTLIFGGGDLTVGGTVTADTVTVSSGMLIGPGTVIAQTSATLGTLTVGGGAHIRNEGTGTWTGNLRTGAGGGSFENTATGQLALSSGGAEIPVVSAGALTVTGSASLGSFDNAGSVDVQAGALTAGSGTHAGSFTVASGASLVVNTVTFEGTSSVSGGGTAQVNAATVSGSWNMTGTTRVRGPGATTFPGTLTSLGSLEVENVADVTIDVDRTVSTLELDGGVLRGAGMLTVTGLTTWMGGTMNGPGSTIAQGGMIMSGNRDRALSGRTLECHGEWTWTGGQFSYRDGSSVLNAAGATFDIQTDDFLSSTGTASTFTNAGTIQKTGGVFPRGFPGTFVQQGTGTLRIGIGGAMAGSEYDRFELTGDVTLDGTIAIDIENAFAPTLGDRFDVVTGMASRTGTFAVVGGDAPGPGLAFDPDYATDPAKLTLEVVASP